MKIQLAGRLGNQLFIWAYALDYFARSGNPVELFYDKFHNLNLDSVDIRDLVADNSGLKICEDNVSGWLLKLIDKFESISPRVRHILVGDRLVRTQNFHYADSDLTDLAPRIIRGYFQSPSYALRQIDIIRQIMNPVINRHFYQISKRVQDTAAPKEYQVIHVRRGDYSNAPQYGELSMRFYLENVDSGYPLFICTDSSDVDQEIRNAFPEASILTPKNSSAWEALALMAKAKKLVIANSTLSWWGGLLASDAGGEVVIPKPWFKDVSLPENHFQVLGMRAANSYFN